MVAIQAHTLDTIFNELARQSQANMGGGYLDAADRYMRLALKAQSQCRATIETLAEIENPKPVAFMQQANIASGPQQVNNAPQPETSRTGRSEIQQSKLLEQTDGNGWTASRKAAQSAAIRQWRPWERSTGPKTSNGKTTVARNAYRGVRPMLRAIAASLKEQRRVLEGL
jgi:hypothetical protein